MPTPDIQRRAKFEAVYPILREELLAHLKQEGMPADAVFWFQRVRISLSMAMRTS